MEKYIYVNSDKFASAASCHSLQSPKHLLFLTVFPFYSFSFNLGSQEDLSVLSLCSFTEDLEIYMMGITNSDQLLYMFSKKMTLLLLAIKNKQAIDFSLEVRPQT